MNSIGAALVWCVIQVTVLAGVASLVYGLVRRSGPPARALASFAGLGLIVALTALTFSPWPRWKLQTDQFHSGFHRAPAPGVHFDQVDTRGDSSELPDGLTTSNFIEPAKPADALSPAAEFFKTLIAEIQQPAVRVETWGWPAYVAIAFLVAAIVGLVRLVVGLAAVQSYRLRARPIHDANLREKVDILLAELRGPPTVVVCESDLLATPATIGWRQPLIILPAEWRNWSDQECRAVLAHEIAHIARHDFATWVAAQFALVFHLYHPLVHWLAARLRLEQELAADAAAAQVTGGKSSYLTTLAGMALRQSDRPLAWPARTFLPTRGTFMRRIEMLRDEKLLTTRMTAGFRTGIVAGLAIVSLAIAGLRGSAADQKPGDGSPAIIAAADDNQPKASQRPARGTGSSGTASTTGTSGSSTTGTVDPLSLAWVPRDSVFVVRFRPAELLNKPALAALKKSLSEQKELRDSLGVALDRVEHVTVFALAGEGQPGRPAEPQLAGFIVRLSEAADAPALLKALQPQPANDEFAGQKYVRGTAGRGPYCFQADERTVASSGREDFIRRMIIAGKTGASRAKWADAWRGADDADIAALFNTAAVRETMNHFATSNPAGVVPGISPLWQDTAVALLKVDCGDQLTLSLDFTVSGAQAAQRVRDTLAAVVTMGQNILSQGRVHFSQLPGAEAAIKLRVADVVDSVLDSVKITNTDDQVRVTASLGADEGAGMFALLLPAIGQAREAAQQHQSMNNLKQLALAMHNYHEANQALPPAILYGPDGKTPYSWRVALLPYLGEPGLYEQYKKDEPWDGPNNKKLIAKIPAVYRDPNSPENSTASSYFVLTGPSTVFSGKDGTKISQILDGLSNTLLFVETRRDVPWTKPEDIPYDKEKPIPKLGGHYAKIFLTALCDGSVRAISENIPDATLRALITCDGGEILDLSNPPAN